MNTKVKIICPVYNGLEYLKKMVSSLVENTDANIYDLILVNNGSNLETTKYLQKISNICPNIKVLTSKTNLGFAGGNNLALDYISNDINWNYLCFVNSDLIFPKNWLINLLEIFKTNKKNIGMVAPISNMAGGWQGRNSNYEIENFNNFANNVYIKAKNNPYRFLDVAHAVGLCLLVTRECFENVGKFDERYIKGNYEDNDLCLRARLNGFRIYIDQSVFIHHFFNKTFSENNIDSRKCFLENRKRFHNKWQDINRNIVQKLVGMCRVKNGMPYIEKTLEKVSELCDEIVILVDHNTTDNTEEICKKFSKVVDVQREKPHEYNEAYSRNYIFDMAKKRNATWVWCFDHDEIPEDKIIKRKYELMNPYNPTVNCWTFNIIQHWNFEDIYRKDGLWGGFQQGRMFRVLPNQKIGGLDDDQVHCGSHPVFPSGETEYSHLKIRHFGNINKDYRYKKYLWYTKTDTNKNLDMILGSWKDYYWKLYYGNITLPNEIKDKVTWKVINKTNKNHVPRYGEFFDEDCYRHVIDEKNIELVKYIESTGITLCMIAKNEEEFISQSINSVKEIVDEIIVVDTGSSDNTKEICRSLGARVIELDWDVYKNGFSYPRNLSIRNASTSWILRIDADEYIPKKYLSEILNLTKENNDGYIFPIKNFLENPNNKKPKWVLSETCRLFRSYPEIEYRGSVHEELDESWKDLAKLRNKRNEKGIIIKKVPFHIYHFGYLKPKQFVDNKFKKYCELAEQMIQENPNDPKSYFTTAVHYYHISDFKKAYKNYKKTIELDPTHWMAYNDISALFFNSGEYLKSHKFSQLAFDNLRIHDSQVYKKKLLENHNLLDIKILERFLY